MVKKQTSVWLEPSDLKKLKQKASENGFAGKGFLSHFLEFVANERVIIIKGSGKIEIVAK